MQTIRQFIILFVFILFHRKTSPLLQCLGMMIADKLVNLVAKGRRILFIGTHIQGQMSVLDPTVVVIIYFFFLDITCTYAERFTILGLLPANVSAIPVVMPTMCRIKKGPCKPFTYGQTPSQYNIDIRLVNWISLVRSFVFSLQINPNSHVVIFGHIQRCVQKGILIFCYSGLLVICFDVTNNIVVKIQTIVTIFIDIAAITKLILLRSLANSPLRNTT